MACTIKCYDVCICGREQVWAARISRARKKGLKSGVRCLYKHDWGWYTEEKASKNIKKEENWVKKYKTKNFSRIGLRAVEFFNNVEITIKNGPTYTGFLEFDIIHNGHTYKCAASPRYLHPIKRKMPRPWSK